jgi:hypothetical protein
MKRLLISITGAAMLLTAGAISAFAQGSNVVSNGDFNTGLSGWTTVAISPSSVTTTTVSPSQGPLVGTVANLTAVNLNDSASLSQLVSLTTGSTYRLAFGYSTNRDFGMTLEVRISNGIDDDLVYNVPLVIGASDTIRDFVIPEGFGSANITFIVTNLSGLSRRAFIDNVSLTKLQ